MSRRNENLPNDVAANSSLQATAQEFVPRSQRQNHSRQFFPSSQRHNVPDRSVKVNKREDGNQMENGHSPWRPHGGRWKNRERDSNHSPRENEGYQGRETSWRDRDSGQQHGFYQNGDGFRGFKRRSGKLSDGKEASDGNVQRRNMASNASLKDDNVVAGNKREISRGNFFNGNRHRYSEAKHVDVRNKDEKNQMEVLIGLLTRGVLECLVCCENIKQSTPTWGCKLCHHVLHLHCVIKWARASASEEGWRCPACQHVSLITPKQYFCFCGKAVDPAWNRSDCPHSCGAMCGLSRSGPCPHKCTLPCHPGPCPPCRLYNTRTCGCGRTSQTVQCSEADPILCGAVCGKTLNCGEHKCEDLCHVENCQPCSTSIKQVCFCGKNNREVPCTKSSVGVSTFVCGTMCERSLDCGNHQCQLICHDGPCPSCDMLPDTVTHCPCGKATLRELSAPPRKSCLDPVPTCGNLCNKTLLCGGPGDEHNCINVCHEGPCPPCLRETTRRCRCGHTQKTLACQELVANSDVRCDKKCNKKKSCGKHKCRETCCIDWSHICLLPCSRTLSCGLHRCEKECHTGYCSPCPRVSFEELPCECGAEVILPPVPCGARRPACTRPCSRQQACPHPPTHNCHSDPTCPPCTVLVSRLCHGGHELRKAIPCHQHEFSCGLPCGKPLTCGRHLCILPCHSGPCLRDDQTCTQPCTLSRPSCGHPCNAPCHDSACPDTPCKETVKVTCECGHRFATRLCVENARDYQRIATAQLASQMAALSLGQSIDLNDIAITNKKMSFKTLECTEECKLIERNRRLAIGLQIRNPDLTAKLTPNYSDFLRLWAKKNSPFCQMVHEKLTELVQLAKQSKQKSRSYSFAPMNRDRRQFIHEYCEHFGCESVAYDPEPQRNIVATAFRDKSWLPGVSLLELIQRESGNRKIPLPSNSKVMPTQKSMEVLSPRTSSSGNSAWGFSSSSNSASYS